MQNANIARTNAKIAHWVDRLADKALEQARYIPPAFLGFVEPTLETEGYKQFIKNVDQWAQVLRAVAEGMNLAWRGRDWNKPGVTAAVNKTVADVDALVTQDDTPPALADVRAHHPEGTERPRKSPEPTTGGAQAMAHPAAAQPPSYEQLMLEMRHISMAAWAIALLVTTALGIYIVVLQNLGFGVWNDFFICIFWGFGLPAAVQQIMTQTAAAVSTEISK